MAEFRNPYFDTPVSVEDEDAFVPGVHFGTKAELWEAEIEALLSVRISLLRAIQDDELSAHDLTQPDAMEKLHFQVNKSIWLWAGRLRKTMVNIGIAPELIRQELYVRLENLQWRVDNMDVHGIPAEVIAMEAHHIMVWIHPFVDGNGRSTRLFADLLLFALTGDRVFEWVDDPIYYEALKRADVTWEVTELLDIVGVEILDED